MTPNSSLLQWLATFQLDGRCSVEIENEAYYDLADGYVCARILNQISPPYFTDRWLEGIRPVPLNGSWRLRVSNLKRILKKIHDYASDLQNSQFRPSAITPDVVVIAQNFDPDQISRLIQLILFCAINCDRKEEYIENIRDLPVQVKQDIKEAIEELLIKNNDRQQRLNTSQTGNDSVHSEIETNLSQKVNIGSSSQNIITSPARSSISYRGSVRRDSSQSDSRKNESHLDTSSNSIYNAASETVDEIRQKLNAAIAQQDERAQACHELERKLEQLQLERDQLAFENERLTSNKTLSSSKKLDDLNRKDNDFGTTNKNVDIRTKNLEEEKSKDSFIQQNRRLQSEVTRMKEEILRLETEKEDFRLKSNLLKEDLDRITTRYDEFRNKAEQAKRLQDELDEHKQIVEKVSNYETMTENLVKKNNEMKSELKTLGEKNLAHIQNIVSLEEEKRQLTDIVNQFEVYKRQLNEAQVKLSHETHRADKAEFELARVTDKYVAAKKDNERLFETTSQLMQSGACKDFTNENLDKNKVFESVSLRNSSSANQLNKTDDIFRNQRDEDALNSITVSNLELKERITRLEVENELLQTKLNSKDEGNKFILNDLLEETSEKCKKLESENRQHRKKIMHLESNLKDLIQSRGIDVTQPSTSGLATGQDSNSDNFSTLVGRVEELQRLLYQKEQDLRDLEAKYKRNIQKARDVMKTLNSSQPAGGSLHPLCMSSASSFNSSSLDETNLLKQQLYDKEQKLIELERDFHNFKRMKEIHERLILSAFYGLTTPLQWKNVEKRLERTTLTSPPNTASSSLNSHSKHTH